ncbi:MAG TPA: PRC-barrel domain-containing protein [Aurantimonas sp.]|nr:PRC-barrel domain-containing protein [Aurantimonas sp.]
MRHFTATATALFLAATPALAQTAVPVDGATARVAPGTAPVTGTTPVAPVTGTATPAVPVTGTVATTPVAAPVDWTQLIRTEDMVDSPVYTTNQAYDENTWGDRNNYTWGWSGYRGIESGWEQIGDVEDVVLDRSGGLVGVVVEVGGFLGLGERNVMLLVDDVELVPVDEESYSLITRFSEDQLTELEQVDEGWWNRP